MPDFKKQAKELIADQRELVEAVMVKNAAAILEEFHDQIKQRDEEIARLKSVLGKTIAWQVREFGQNNVESLLKELEGDDV